MENETTVKDGNPNRRSPAAVDRDKKYEFVASLDGGTYPSSVQHVVKHKETGNLWACRYVVYKDSSDYDMSVSWGRVEEKTKTITTYETVRS